jgi:polysaccharide pyruvyl transferase CsaB
MENSEKKHLFIAGYYGFGNTGDETILASMLADLRRQRENLDITIVSGNPAETEIMHRVKSVLWTDTVQISRAIQSSDLIILGGGGIFHDQFGFPEEYLLTRNHSGISFYSGFALLAAMYQKPLMLYAVGVGPLLSEAGRRLTKLSFEASNVATVRDVESYEVMETLGVDPAKIQVTADPAFNLEPDIQRAQKVLRSANLPSRDGSPLIAVCVRFWDIYVSLEEWQKKLAQALDQFIERVDGEVLFIPFQNSEATSDVNDVAIALTIRGMMRNQDRSSILNQEYPPETISGLIASCDFVIGMRYHSVIFSIMNGKPLVGLAYDPKVRHILRQVGMSDYIFDLATLSSDSLAEAMYGAWTKKDTLCESLTASSKALKESAQKNTTLALSLLDKPIPASRKNISDPFLWDLIKRQNHYLAENERTLAENIKALFDTRKALAESELTVQRLNAEIAEIQLRKSSTLLRLLPPGSVPYRVVRMIKREGWRVFITRLYQKITVTYQNKFVQPVKLESIATIPPSSGKLDIICFPVIDWDFRFQRPQQLLSQFARNGHRVFYIRTQFKGTTEATVDVRQITEGVYEITLPGDASTVIYRDDLTRETLKKSFDALASLIKNEHLINPLCLLDHPFWTPLAEQLNKQFNSKIVYDCMDDHSGFEVTHPQFQARESSLIATSDMVVTTSQILFDRLSKIHKNCILVPNAGDFDHFNRIPVREISPIAELPRPVIGYYGAIAEWFDTASIHAAATRHPDWSFAMIGNTTGVDLRELKKLPNVHFLGEKPYKSLPAYLAGFDVATIPFRRIPLTEATNPVKVFEYLSAGKPVVATSLPELLPHKEVLYLYSTPEELTSKLEQALEEDNIQVQEKRVELARNNTWEMRYRSLQSSIDTLYGKASIVIVTWNNLDYTRQCIQSLLADQTWPNLKLIVVDNASTDGTVQYLTELSEGNENILCLANRENLGFAAANNIGLKHVEDSEYVVLLNNDTVVPKGWLANLLKHLKNPEIGAVGPVTNSIGNEAMIEVPYTDVKEMERFALAYTAEHEAEFFEIGVLAMYCMAMRREVFDQVGPLDERFGVGMFEDDDYARRLREKGFRIICAEDAFVHHWGRASFSKLNNTEYTEIFEKNLALFEEKWNVKWSPHKALRRRKTTM